MLKFFKKIGKILAVAIFCGIGAVCGILFSNTVFSGEYAISDVAIILLGIILEFYIAIIIHEAGHLIFGLATGYGFLSFRVGSFMWIKQDGKIRFKRFSLAGTGGQCIMTPPEVKNGKIKTTLYNLGGVILNLALTLIFGAFYFLLFSTPIFSEIFLFGALASFVMALSNGIPLDMGGISNDGMNAILLRSGAANESFRKQLLINSAISEGKSIGDIPVEYFEIPEGGDMGNAMVATIAVFNCNREMGIGNLDESLYKMEILLNSPAGIIDLHRKLLINDCIFIHLLKGRTDSAKALLGTEQKKLMKSMRNYPAILRTQYAIASVMDKNAEMAEKAKQKLLDLKNTYPYEGELESEIALLDKFVNEAKTEQ